MLKKISPHGKLFLLFLGMVAALPPFAIDTYSPAIPNIALHFSVSSPQVIVTLATYFIGFALGNFVWGGFSDHFGRKKILATGVILYVISTLLCGMSTHFIELEIFRLIQGFGDAACSSCAFAIMRDVSSGSELTKRLSSLTMIIMIAPVISPLIGSFIIKYFHEWQYVFHFLTIYGLVLILILFKIPETHPIEKRAQNVLFAFSSFKSHLKNPKFVYYTSLSCLCFGVSFAFVAASAVVYMQLYHASSLEYALLFAINSFSIILSNFLIKHHFHKIPLYLLQRVTVSAVFVVAAVGFFMVHTFPHHMWLFVAILFLVTFLLSLSMSTFISDTMNSVEKDFGVATSIMNSLRFIAGAAGSYVISSLPEHNLNANLLFFQASILFFIVLIFFTGLKKYKN